MTYTQLKALAPNLPTYEYIRQIKYDNKASGFCFFSPGTMRVWASRVHSQVYGGCIFVTSEKNQSWRYEFARAYTIRMIDRTGSIRTIGEYQAFETRYAAHTYAKRLGDIITANRG